MLINNKRYMLYKILLGWRLRNKPNVLHRLNTIFCMYNENKQIKRKVIILCAQQKLRDLRTLFAKSSIYFPSVSSTKTSRRQASLHDSFLFIATLCHDLSVSRCLCLLVTIYLSGLETIYLISKRVGIIDSLVLV